MSLNLKTRNVLLLVFKIFFVWLFLQFFFQTFVTFELWWKGIFWKIVRAWKEILIVLWSVFIFGFFVKKIRFRSFEVLKSDVSKKWHELKFDKMPIIRFILVFLVTFLLSLLISLLINKVWIWAYILSVKYNLLWFFIFILSFVLARLFLDINDIKIVAWYNRLFKIALVWAGFWWIMVWLMPNFLKFFGYNQFNYEWTLGAEPPAAYYTMINQWYVRNQFLFERPISFGFFLVALWPVFFFSVLKGKSKKEMRTWSIFYGLIVGSTLSRAAIWVWLLISIIMVLLINFYRLKKVVWRLIVPLIVLTLVGALFFYKTGWERVHSNIGHIQLPLEWIKIIWEDPIFGRWAWYAWPASHQICFESTDNARCQRIDEINNKYEISTIGFNPENQYIQIWIEYWILWFAWWILMFLMLHYIWYQAWIDQTKKSFSKHIRSHSWILIGFSLGLLWLAIEWLVLHSFVDRMIVYPFMAMFGLAYALYYKETHEREIK
jgi:hypothetical protein